LPEFPDSNWLIALSKVDPMVSGALTAAAGSVLLMAHYDVGPFKSLPQVFVGTIAVAGLLFGFLLIFRALTALIQHWKYGIGGGVAKKLSNLSEQQRNFLLQIYRRGSRSFEMPIDSTSQRWFEELKNWRYVESQTVLIYVSGSPFPYKISEAGWEQLEASAKSH